MQLTHGDIYADDFAARDILNGMARRAWSCLAV